MQKAFFVVILTALLAFPAGAEETLKDALALAYGQSPLLSAAQAEQRARDEAVPQALSNWRPTIAANADISSVHTDDNAQFSNSGLIPRNLGGTITQPVYRGGRTVAATQQAKSEVAAGRAELSAAEQALLLATVTAYYDVVRDQSVVELARNNEQVLRKQLEAAQSRFDVGEITRTDVSQAESRLAGAEAERVLAEGDLNASRATYVRLVGKAPEDLVRELPKDFAAPQDLAALLSQAEGNNPRVLAAQAALRSAKAAIGVQRGALYPEISLNVRGGRSWDQSSFTAGSGGVNSSQVTAQMTVPIFNSADHSRVRQAKQVYGQRRYEQDEALRHTREDAIRAWEVLKAAEQAIVAREAQVTAAQLALEGVRRESEVGTRTTLDVLDAEQELLDAKVNLLRAERDRAVALFQTYVAAGRMNARDLGLDVALYDADQHYEQVRGKWAGWGDPEAAE